MTTPLRRKPQVKKNRSKVLRLPTNLPAYQGQTVKTFKLAAEPVLLTTTVTTGEIAALFDVTAPSVNDFATRFGSLFEEYRIVKAQISVKCFSSTNTGLFTHWFDEKNFAPPTLAEALQKSDKQFSASSPSPHVLTWHARDPLDLQYTPTSAAVQPCAYKVYTNATDFGSSIVATPYAQLSIVMWIQFRGYL